MKRSSMQRFTLALTLSLLLWGGWNSQAHAQYGYHGGVTHHGELKELAALRMSFFSGIPDLVGASLSIRALRPLELEFGLATLGLGWTAYARAGAAWTLAERRGWHGRGASLVALGMVGYRFLEAGVIGPSNQAHGITASVALEGTLWLARHFGLTAQASVGGGMWLIAKNQDMPQLYPDLRFSVGIAF